MSLEDKLYKYLSFYKEMPDWTKIILASPFKIYPRETYLGSNFKAFYNEAKMLEFVSKEKIEEYQFLKLKQLLHHAYTTVPYYYNEWNKFGINLNQIQNFDDFSKSIPFVKKDDLQSFPLEFLSNKFPLKRHLKSNSGGSTGIPLTLFSLKGYSRSAEWAHMFLQWERVGFIQGKRLARLRGDYVGKNKIYSFDPWRNYLMLSSFSLDSSNADIYVQLLNKYKIEYINAYPSSLFNLIQLSKENSVNIPSLKVIFLGSENIYNWQLKKIRDFFGIKRIYYWYGHGELCALGGGCELSSQYHFMPSYSYVEFIADHEINGCHENNKLVEIVGSSFINPVMSLIRYRSQDFGTESVQKCPCGRNHKLLKEIIGREQELAIGLNRERITLTALIFGRHSEYFNHIIKMQVINYAPGKLKILILPKASFNKKNKNEIISSLSMKEGMPFKTKVEIIDRIETTKGGKHRFLLRTFE